MQAEYGKIRQRQSKFPVTAKSSYSTITVADRAEAPEIYPSLTCADTIPKIKDNATVFPFLLQGELEQRGY